MKRSKIFLGVTTVLLAFAGLAATNAHRGLIRKCFTYTKITSPQTFPIILMTFCTAFGVTSQCYYQSGSIHAPLSTKGGIGITGGKVVYYNPQ